MLNLNFKLVFLMSVFFLQNFAIGNTDALAVDKTKNILFLDVNNSPGEITSLKKTASDLNYHLDVLYDQKNQMDTTDALKNAYKLNTKSFDILFISGHHGSNFYGDNGSFVESDLIAIFKKNPELLEKFKNLEQIYLLGCSSGSSFLLKRWKSIFPSLKLAFAYAEQAPLGNKPQGHQYFDYFLKKSSTIIQYLDTINSNSSTGTFTIPEKMLDIYKKYDYQRFDSSNVPGMAIYPNNQYINLIYLKQAGKRVQVDYINNNLIESCEKLFNAPDTNGANRVLIKLAAYFNQYHQNLSLSPSEQTKNFWSDFHLYYSDNKLCISYLFNKESTSFIGASTSVTSDVDYNRFQEKYLKIFNSHLQNNNQLTFRTIQEWLNSKNFDSHLFLLKYFHNVTVNFFSEITKTEKNNYNLASFIESLKNLTPTTLANADEINANWLFNLKDKVSTLIDQYYEEANYDFEFLNNKTLYSNFCSSVVANNSNQYGENVKINCLRFLYLEKILSQLNLYNVEEIKKAFLPSNQNIHLTKDDFKTLVQKTIKDLSDTGRSATTQPVNYIDLQGQLKSLDYLANFMSMNDFIFYSAYQGVLREVNASLIPFIWHEKNPGEIVKLNVASLIANRQLMLKASGLYINEFNEVARKILQLPASVRGSGYPYL